MSRRTIIEGNIVGYLSNLYRRDYHHFARRVIEGLDHFVGNSKGHRGIMIFIRKGTMMILYIEGLLLKYPYF